MDLASSVQAKLMNGFGHGTRFSPILVTVAAAMVLQGVGCAGSPTTEEQQAWQHQEAVARGYRPGGERPTLPTLDANSPLQDFLLYAMLKAPQVEAAWFDWAASVQGITVARSRPDPRLAFEADITDTVMALVPGLMTELPGPGKLQAAASVATAASEARYFAFESSVLQTAYALKKAYYELYFLDARVDVNRETLGLVREIETLALAKNAVGKATLQDVLRAQIEQERLSTEIANLEDSRTPLLAAFKAALGLQPQDPAPPVPATAESTSLKLTSDELLDQALARNPRLQAMAAEVRRADASIRLAYKARVPDFSAGLEVDVDPSPAIFTPSIGMTLPVWRDKIAAQIAAAQAEKQAAAARLDAEEIALAVDFAEKSFLFREASRTLTLLTERLLPKANQSLEVAQSGYVSGKVDFLNLLDAERTLLEFRRAEVEARVRRELALADLSLLILSTPPTGAPLLPLDAYPVEDQT